MAKYNPPEVDPSQATPDDDPRNRPELREFLEQTALIFEGLEATGARATGEDIGNACRVARKLGFRYDNPERPPDGWTPSSERPELAKLFDHCFDQNADAIREPIKLSVGYIASYRRS